MDRISLTIEKETLDDFDKFLEQFKGISRSLAITLAMDFAAKSPKFISILKQFEE